MTCRPPLTCLSSDKLLGHSRTSLVFWIDDNIVLKSPYYFEPDEKPTTDRPRLEQTSYNSIKCIESEKEVYDILMKKPHPNLMQCLLHVPEGIFLPRLTSLPERLSQQETNPISGGTKLRWSTELVSGATWLEGLGLAHGDIRPANLFLDRQDHIKLGDFDSTVEVGANLKAFTVPFWMSKTDGDLDKAGPKSEQFAIGSCIYTIFTGNEPKLKDDGIQSRHGEYEFPDTRYIYCGSIILKCWKGMYGSVAGLSRDMEKERLGNSILRSTVTRLYDSVTQWIGISSSKSQLIPCNDFELMRNACEVLLAMERPEALGLPMP